MSWYLVPLNFGDFGYFDRQRDLFSDWVRHFDNDWRAMELQDSRRRFDEHLDNTRSRMHRMDIQPIALDIEQPFVTDPEGNRKLSLRFDCSKFEPKEIQVKTQDRVLTVHAKHVEESPGRKVHQEFTRKYTLPDDVDPKALTSHLSRDGVLQIEGPAPPAVEAPKEHLIPIEKLADDCTKTE